MGNGILTEYQRRRYCVLLLQGTVGEDIWLTFIGLVGFSFWNAKISGISSMCVHLPDLSF